MHRSRWTRLYRDVSVENGVGSGWETGKVMDDRNADNAPTSTRWPMLLLYIVLISLAAYASDRIATFERGILASFAR